MVIKVFFIPSTVVSNEEIKFSTFYPSTGKNCQTMKGGNFSRTTQLIPPPVRQNPGQHKASHAVNENILVILCSSSKFQLNVPGFEPVLIKR